MHRLSRIIEMLAVHKACIRLDVKESEEGRGGQANYFGIRYPDHEGGASYARMGSNSEDFGLY